MAVASLWVICGSSVLGFAALSGWLVLRSRPRWALATGAVGVVFTAGLFLAGHLESREVLGIHRSAAGDVRYGRERGTLQYGSCVVSIPREHTVGQLERPSLLRLELRARPDRHVMLQQILPCDEAEFYEAVRQRVASAPSRDLFVFVHGYNVSFELAAPHGSDGPRSALPGAPLFYSWPSQAEPWNYAIDENNVAWTVPHLKKFLVDLASHSDAQAINLIAHSMGNRALTQAVRELAADLRVTGKMFQQVILAAPDIDADVFERDIAPVLTQLSSQVTLYASAHDDALAASRMVHGYRRAGDMNGAARRAGRLDRRRIDGGHEPVGTLVLRQQRVDSTGPGRVDSPLAAGISAALAESGRRGDCTVLAIRAAWRHATRVATIHAHRANA